MSIVPGDDETVYRLTWTPYANSALFMEKQTGELAAVRLRAVELSEKHPGVWVDVMEEESAVMVAMVRDGIVHP